MSSTYSVFFSKEITCLPSILDKYIGKYYNNAMGNAVSWGFFIWLTIHYIFDRLINSILKQMKYPEYLRMRIKSTLWNFGFYAGSFMYCYATLARNNVEVFTFHKKFLAREVEFIPGQYFFGFLFLSTYYAHSAFWEGTQTNCIFTTLEQCSILFLSTLCYINGCVELLFLVVYINNLIQCVLELSRTFSFQLYNRFFMNIISTIYFVFHLFLSLFVYFIIFPIYINIPVGRHLKTKLNISFILLNFVLWLWFLCSIYNSVICKLIKHYIWHINKNEAICKKSFVLCALFPPRTDTAFTIVKLRKEIEERKALVNIQRKKPNETLFQTLKCVVSFRRKCKRRRENHSDNYLIARGILDEILSNICNENSNE